MSVKIDKENGRFLWSIACEGNSCRDFFYINSDLDVLTFSVHFHIFHLSFVPNRKPSRSSTSPPTVAWTRRANPIIWVKHWSQCIRARMITPSNDGRFRINAMPGLADRNRDKIGRGGGYRGRQFWSNSGHNASMCT